MRAKLLGANPPQTPRFIATPRHASLRSVLAMRFAWAALWIAIVPASVHAQPRVDRVITASSDARDLASLGDTELVATEGGLLVLRDGEPQRIVDGLPGVRARSLSVTDEGVWVGALEGTALLTPTLSVVRTLPLRRVRRVVRFGGRTWLASYGDGLSRLDASSLTRVALGRTPAYAQLTDAVVRGDELWVATFGAGIQRVGPDGRARGQIRARDGLASDYVWRLSPIGDRIVVSTVDGVTEIDAHARVDRASALSESARTLPVRDVRAVALDGNTVFFGTFGRGVWRANVGQRASMVRGPFAQTNALLRTDAGVLVAHAGGVHRLHGTSAEPIVAGGLPSGDVTALERAFGALWMGTFAHGLARMRDGSIEPLRAAHERWGVDRRINDLLATGRGASARLWIATDRGVYWHDGRIFSRVEDPAGPGLVHATALDVDRGGALWVTTSRQLCRFASERWRCWTGGPTLPIAQLHAVTSDSRGRVWVGSLHGLYRFDAASGRFTRHTVSSGALPVDWVTALVPWQDGILAGTYHGGLVIGDGAHFRTVREGEDGLASGWINPHAIRTIGDQAWIGTLERGLIVGRPGRWQHLTTAHGLPSNDVTDVLADRDGIWVATRGGLVRFAR